MQPLDQRPQHQPQPRRRGFQHQLLENRELSETHPVLAQQPALVLIERLHIIRNLGARHNAHRLDDAEGNPLGQPGQRLVIAQRNQRLELRGNPAFDEMPQTATHFLRHFRPGFLVHERLHLRRQRIGARHQLAHRIFAPHQAALFGDVHFRVRRVIEFVRAQAEHRLKRGNRGGFQGFGLFATRGLVQLETEALQFTHKLALDRHFTVFVHFRHKGLLLFQSAQQYAGAPVDKSLCQRQMQRIRQPVLDRAGLGPPMRGVLNPLFSLGNIGPGADKSQPF